MNFGWSQRLVLWFFIWQLIVNVFADPLFSILFHISASVYFCTFCAVVEELPADGEHLWDVPRPKRTREGCGRGATEGRGCCLPAAAAAVALPRVGAGASARCRGAHPPWFPGASVSGRLPRGEDRHGGIWPAGSLGLVFLQLSFFLLLGVSFAAQFFGYLGLFFLQPVFFGY